MSTSPKVFFGVFLIFAIGVITGYGLFVFLDRDAHSNVSSNSKQIRQVGEYRYINPLLECEVAEGTIDARKQNFRDELVREIERL